MAHQATEQPPPPSLVERVEVCEQKDDETEKGLSILAERCRRLEAVIFGVSS